MKKGYVTASELADFIYCECCWADRVEGKRLVTMQMEEGTSAHERINSQYFLIRLLRRIAFVIIIVGIIAAAVIYILSSSGIMRL